MKTLITYDMSGRVWNCIQGDYELPTEGMLYIEADLDLESYVVERVDVSVEPHSPILCPKELLGLSMDQYKEKLIGELKDNLAAFLKENPVRSTCHGGVSKFYSATKEKQDLLLIEIKTVEYAMAHNINYAPSWNAYQEEATKDWTLDELYQLLYDIKRYVGPIVEEQQMIENDIRNAQSVEELIRVDITFE